MTHRLTIDYAKNYCNRTLIVEVIVENVVTCFLGTQCILLSILVKLNDEIGFPLTHIIKFSLECYY